MSVVTPNRLARPIEAVSVGRPDVTSPQTAHGQDVELVSRVDLVSWVDVAGDGVLTLSWVSDFFVEAVAIAEVAFVLVAAGMTVSVIGLAGCRVQHLALVAVPVLAAGVLGLVRLPVSAAAVFLLALAGASLVMEVLAAPGLLLHAVGGGLALAMGGVCLHHPGTGAHPGLVVPVSLAVAAGTWLAGRRSWRVVREDPFTGSDRLIGRIATVLDADGHQGYAVVAGQVWAISGSGRPLVAGGRVRVVSREEGRLIVKPSRVPPP